MNSTPQQNAGMLRYFFTCINGATETAIDARDRVSFSAELNQHNAPCSRPWETAGGFLDLQSAK